MFGLTEMSRQEMIIIILEYAKSKIWGVRNIDTVLLMIEFIGIKGGMQNRKSRIRW